MIEIKTKKNEIPVKIGELEFSFSMTDKTVIEFEEIAAKAEKNLVKLVEDYNDNKITEAVTIEKLNKELEAMYDLILGSGAYKKIYKQSPSALDNMEIFMDLMPAIRSEYDNLMNEREAERKKKIDKYKQRAKK